MRKWLLLLALLLTASSAYAFDCPGITQSLPSKGSQTLTVSSSAVGLTIPSSVQAATVSVETNGVRFWDNGDTPTATVGKPAGAGSELLICQPQLSPIKFIATGSDATLSVSYYGR